MKPIEEKDTILEEVKPTPKESTKDKFKYQINEEILKKLKKDNPQ